MGAKHAKAVLLPFFIFIKKTKKGDVNQ